MNNQASPVLCLCNWFSEPKWRSPPFPLLWRPGFLAASNRKLAETNLNKKDELLCWYIWRARKMGQLECWLSLLRDAQWLHFLIEISFGTPMLAAPGSFCHNLSHRRNDSLIQSSSFQPRKEWSESSMYQSLLSCLCPQDRVRSCQTLNRLLCPGKLRLRKWWFPAEFRVWQGRHSPKGMRNTFSKRNGGCLELSDLAK